MINLERGCLAITATQYGLLKADERTVRDTCSNVGISEGNFRDLLRNANMEVGNPYAEFALMQALAIMSYVALNSDKGINKHVGEYMIGIRCSNNPYDIHEPCYIDVDGVNVFQIYQDFNSDYTWTVHYMHPGVTDNEYLLKSVMRAAKY